LLTDLRILFTVVVIACVLGIYGAVSRHAGKYGFLTLVWWHLSGHTWNGTHLTDAGWFSPATDKPARTNTGRTRRFYYRPRAERAARRCARYAVMVFLAVFWLSEPLWLSVLVTVLIVGTAAAWAGWRIWCRLAERKHYRTWIQPLHLAAAHQVGIPRAVDGRDWLEIAPDRSRAALALPQGYNPKEGDQQHLVRTVTAKLGMEAPEVRWLLAGPRPRLELTASAPPPPKVVLGDVLGAIDSAKPDEFVWGIGKRNTLITTSLSMDSPHIGLSIGSGGGKSISARAFLAQLLYRGALAVVLDVKMLSQHWAAFGSQLPNVLIARSPAEVHNTLLWLGEELTRRNTEALKHADIEGNAPPEVIGPRLIVVAEEMNATIGYLRGYWRRVRDPREDPVRSPALEALGALSFMGRQAQMNMVCIAQRLSVKGLGGDGDMKENIGTIALGRYSPPNWRMNAEDFPMPPKSMVPGRLQVVTDKVQEVQGVYMSGAEARRLAGAGEVALFPPEAPGARVIAGRVEHLNGAEQHRVTDTSPVRPELPPPRCYRSGNTRRSLRTGHRGPHPRRAEAGPVPRAAA